MIIKTEPLRQFFEFLTERQNIWYRRFVEKKPPPWTDNPVLRDNHCCNVYRELDRGTLFATEKIIGSSDKPEHVLFRLLLYRMFNDINTYKALQPILNKFTAEKAVEILTERKEKGHTIFRNAWLTAGTGLHGPGSKVADYTRVAEEVFEDRREFFGRIAQCKGIQSGFEAIRTVKWFGGFMGYQVALDYSYIPWLEWKDDGWVYVGPGAKKGVYWLMGKKPLNDRDLFDLQLENNDNPINFEKYIRYLQLNQRSYFKKFGLKFKRWNDKDLDQHNLEFALCEFNKVSRSGFGGKRKVYDYSKYKVPDMSPSGLQR